jgi:hypothetical protein
MSDEPKADEEVSEDDEEISEEDGCEEGQAKNKEKDQAGYPVIGSSDSVISPSVIGMMTCGGAT